MFWKEEKKVWEGDKGGSMNVKDKNGQMLVKKHDRVERWRERFSELLNVKNDRTANSRVGFGREKKRGSGGGGGNQ